MLESFDRHRVNLVVPIRLKEPFRVGAIGLVAPDVRSNIVGWEQSHRVRERLDLASQW